MLLLTHLSFLCRNRASLKKFISLNKLLFAEALSSLCFFMGYMAHAYMRQVNKFIFQGEK
jgi:hypothetical protein